MDIVTQLTAACTKDNPDERCTFAEVFFCFATFVFSDDSMSPIFKQKLSLTPTTTVC